MEEKTFSVSEINSYLNKKFKGDPNLKNIYVKGEISNYKTYPSGHSYFTLKDEDSQIPAVFFKFYKNRSLTFEPKDGMKVIVKGKIEVYEKDGKYQLYVTKITEDGIGILYAKYEQLKKDLEREGLFDDAHKKEIQKYPKRIGVVTAQTGAVIKDIITTVRRRYPICEILLFIVLEKKQPIYIDKTRREIFESMLNNTNISMNDLEQFLKIQLKDGINYTYSLKKLSKENNPYASFELGDMEYTGIMSGSPRYVKAYEYFKIAAAQNHPRANWLIGKMLLEGQIGKKTEETKEKAFKYLKKAEELGSIAATNTIGLCYLSGLIPSILKNEEKAIFYFKKAAKEDYVYAHNNLGKIYEEHGDLKKAYEHYMVGATLEESWASNKIGKWYLEGTYIEKDEKQAYEYFNKATEVPKSILDHWAYFNLAKYFYLNGNFEANIEKNIPKAIEYFNKALEGNIEDAYNELILIYIEKFKKNENQKDLDYINFYYNKFRHTTSYKYYKKEIDSKIEELVKNKILLIKNGWQQVTSILN